MEPRADISKWKNKSPPLSSIEEYYEFGTNFCTDVYPRELDRYRNVKFEEIIDLDFWHEYIWCVYVSGFSSKVLDKLFPKLAKAYGDFLDVTKDTWDRVRLVNANRSKFEAIQFTAQLLRTLGWESFKNRYLLSIEDIKKLGYMGPVTSQHLARNLGVDAVKPDLHLVRLSDHFGFDTPYEMCSFLSGLSDERIGVVDLILFYTASTFGTLGIKQPGGR